MVGTTYGDAARMAGDSKPEESRSSKDCWHVYSLQNLPPAKFIDVVNKVIEGRYRMVSSRYGIIGAFSGNSAAKKDV